MVHIPSHDPFTQYLMHSGVQSIPTSFMSCEYTSTPQATLILLRQQTLPDPLEGLLGGLLFLSMCMNRSRAAWRESGGLITCQS